MGFATRIRPHVTAELHRAEAAEADGDAALAFRHLERAHILGQASTREHVRVHLRMLGWALRHRRHTEIRGQLLRVAGAASKTALGLVPTGNTGGADISAFKRLAIPSDLHARIATALSQR